MPAANHLWQTIKPDYKFLDVLGQGTFGMVMHAKHRKTSTDVAIKLVQTKFNSQVECKNVMRELSILRQFNEMKGNIFVTRLMDVIVAPNVEGTTLENAEGIFFVLEHVPNDLKNMIKLVDHENFEEEHIKIILYNLLCALNFIHTANIMHRDIKPANLLIDNSCQVKLCDFGQARTVPEKFKPKVLSQQPVVGKHKKMLSNHICSRWYRPPEIVLT